MRTQSQSATMIVWPILGCLLLGAAIFVVVRMDAAVLGVHSTRLLGIAAWCIGYYGLLRWARFGQPRAAALRWPFLHYAVPAAAGAGALYCLWRVARNWRAEVHGVLKTLLTLSAVLLLGALAWLCLTRAS